MFISIRSHLEPHITWQTTLTLAERNDPDLAESLVRMGLLAPGEPFEAEPLTGGVSSDIRLVQIQGRRFCLKKALPTLRVAAHWEAPVSRNAAEVAWIRFVAGDLPGAVPSILGEDRLAGLFAMAYFEPEQHPVWKSLLLGGTDDPAFAGEVGRSLATIHGRSAGSAALETAFANQDSFERLRLDPYLRATGRADPTIAPALERLANRTATSRIALMHGDVSPKNILVGPNGPIFLDAECACYGDPAFDLAFCLNHLLLKGARLGASRERYLASFDRLARDYLALVTWEEPLELERRTAALLPGLFLARVDGKSPVEYLRSEAERDAVRRCAFPFVLEPPSRLDTIRSAWASQT